MADEGPTTVGSIDARLTLDADQFEREARRAEEQADRLDGRDVHIDVNARGTAAALADLERLQMAERRLRAAELDLDQVRRLSTATQQQRLRAENAVSAATIAYQQANERAARGIEARAAAEDHGTESTDRAADAHHRNADAQKASFSAMQGLIAASPLLLGATATLAAATAGLAVAFGVMAGAGVAAIVGIKQEMQQGTVTGQAYTAQLGMLKTSLSQLGSTGAQAFLSGFSQAADTVNRAMPVLNQYVSEGAAALGAMGANIVGSVITGLERMQPLIQAGTTGLSQFVGWLMQASSTTGFGEFVAYATAQLPNVIGLLESLVTLVGHLIAAFAPLGPVVLGAIGMLADMLNALPLPVLAGLTTMIVALPAALNLAKLAVSTFGTAAATAGGQMTLFGISANLAIPIVGVLVAALAALTIGIAASASSQQAAIPTAAEYADALERDSNKVGEYTTKLAAKKLAEAGAYDAVSQLGLGTDVLTKAVTGNADASKILHDRINEVKKAYDDATAGAIASNGALHGATDAQIAARDAADKLLPVLDGNTKAIQDQQHANEMFKEGTQGYTQAEIDKQNALVAGASVLGVTTTALQAAQDAQKKNADSAAATTLQYQLENNAAGLLKLTLDGLNGTSLSAAQAQNAFDSQLANMGTHVDKVGNQVQFTTANIDNMSAASVALRGQLNSQVSAAEQSAEAFGQMSNSSEAGRQKLIDLRQQIIDNAVAHGVDRDAVTAYIDKILSIPKSVPPTKIEADTAAAESNVLRLQNAIDALHDRTITITTVNTGQGENAPGTAGGGTRFANALGGFAGSGVAYLAAGGIAGHFARGTDTIPTMLTKGEFVVNRSASTTLERDHPGALAHMNRTGQLPVQQAAGAVVVQPVIHVYVGGEELDARTVGIVQDQIGRAARDAVYLRPGT